MFQIYKEGISDLLTSVTPSTPPVESFSLLSDNEESLAQFHLRSRLLNLREYPDKSLVIDGLSQFPIASKESAIALISTGSANRITRSVTANEYSSRSHVITQFTIACQDAVEDGKRSQKIRTSTLMFVDLAGSERIRKCGSINDRHTLSEAQSINKSISTLGLCIHTLANAGDRGVKPAHVPFRFY